MTHRDFIVLQGPARLHGLAMRKASSSGTGLQKRSVAVSVKQFCEQHGFRPRRAIPFSMASSSGRIEILDEAFPSGQRKRPRSNRFAHTHSPLPSQTSAFSLVCERFVKGNSCPLSGSARADRAPARGVLRSLCACPRGEDTPRRLSRRLHSHLHQLRSRSSLRSRFPHGLLPVVIERAHRDPQSPAILLPP